jgi:hypothetical protein
VTLEYGYPDPEDISRLSEELRRKGMQDRQLDKLRAFWGEACLDPTKRGILREAPDAKSGTPDQPAQLPDVPEPPPEEDRETLLELLGRSVPFPDVSELAPPEEEGIL